MTACEVITPLPDHPIERMARAMSAQMVGTREQYAWRAYVPFVRAGLEALKYSDGVDEERLLCGVSHRLRMDPVAVSEAWDALIDAILAEPTA